MSTQYALLAVLDQGVEDSVSRKELPGIFLDPQPGSHFKRQWQKNTVGVITSLLIQMIPQVSMRQILNTLRLEDILVMTVRLQKHFLERMYFSQMLDRLSRVGIGKPNPVADANPE